MGLAMAVRIIGLESDGEGVDSLKAFIQERRACPQGLGWSFGC